MNIAGMPATGYEIVGDIVGTHLSQYHFQADVSSVVMDVLTDHTSMAPVVTEQTPISDVLRIFEDKKLLIIPVIRNGQIIESITRHDPIRAMSGAGLGVEK